MTYFDPEKGYVVWEESYGREETDEEIVVADMELMREMGI